MRGLTQFCIAWMALALVACSGSGTGGSATGGSDGTDGADGGKVAIEVPEGNDNMLPLSQQTGVDGITFGALASVNDQTLYVCTGAHGLQVASINEKYEFKSVVGNGSFPDGSGCREISVADDGTVFVTGLSKTAGSWLVSLKSTPSADGDVPLAATITIDDALAEDVLATKSHVFVALGEKGVRIYGRNDGELAEVGRVSSLKNSLGLAIWKEESGKAADGNPTYTDSLIVARGSSGLTVVDISDPTSPSVAKEIGVFGTARRVEVQDDLAWVAGVNVGVGAYDLNSDKKKPRVGTWKTHSSAQDLTILPSGRIYVANWEDLVVLDASNYKDIAMVGTEAIKASDSGSSHVIAVAATMNPDIAFVSEWSGYWSYYVASGRQAPDIRLSRTKVDFGVVKKGFKGKGINIDNLGTKNLEITELKVDDPHFTVNLDWVDFADGEAGKLPATVKPGDTGILEVRFDVANWEEETKASLTLTTNDPDEASIVIPLRANVFDGVQVGGPFKSDDEDLTYLETETGNDITVNDPKLSGKVIVMAYFATW